MAFIKINKSALNDFNAGAIVNAFMFGDDGDIIGVKVVKALNGKAALVDTKALAEYGASFPYKKIEAPRKSCASTYVPSNELFQQAIEKCLKGDNTPVCDTKRYYKGQSIPVYFSVKRINPNNNSSSDWSNFIPTFNYAPPLLDGVDPLEVK